MSAHLFSRAAARIGFVICAVFLAHCATERLSARAPAGVNLGGTWKLNPSLSDDPEKVVGQQHQESPPWSGAHGRHRGGGGGLPPFGNSGRGSWPSGGTQDWAGGTDGSAAAIDNRDQRFAGSENRGAGGANDQNGRLRGAPVHVLCTRIFWCRRKM